MKWRLVDLTNDHWQLVDLIGAVHADIMRSYGEDVDYPLPEYMLDVREVYETGEHKHGRKGMIFPGAGGYVRTAEGAMLAVEEMLELDHDAVEIVDG